MFVSVIVRPEAEAEQEGRRVLAALKAARIDHARFESAADARGDMLVVVGDNAFLLATLRERAPDIPVLGVGSSGFGVLMEVTVAEFEANVKRLRAGDFWVEPVDRMLCQVGERAFAALNEAAIVSAQAGQFVRYSLWVDDELVWRDRGDGVIVATPTGSTAYALSAGGPIVLSRARVFSCVPICSGDDNHPLVVTQDARVSVTDVTATSGVDMVLDGRERVRIGRNEVIRIQRHDVPARFVRFGEKRYTRILGKLKREGEPSPVLGDAPPSARFVLKLLEFEGPLTQQEMIRESGLSPRTIRNAVTFLLSNGFVTKEPSLRDARQDVYTLR
ncbi:MAG TPA: MarR family transcriptional regulator [Candidatus Thermoplasmatota archaeon]|nr:MarR family transcriptional regulator [Candidatus Thermoplasmatota archaeon]